VYLAILRVFGWIQCIWLYSGYLAEFSVSGYTQCKLQTYTQCSCSISSISYKPILSVSCKPILSVSCRISSISCKPILSVSCKPILSVSCKPILSVSCKPILSVSCKPVARCWHYSNAATALLQRALTHSEWGHELCCTHKCQGSSVRSHILKGSVSCAAHTAVKASLKALLVQAPVTLWRRLWHSDRIATIYAGCANAETSAPMCTFVSVTTSILNPNTYLYCTYTFKRHSYCLQYLFIVYFVQAHGVQKAF